MKKIVIAVFLFAASFAFVGQEVIAKTVHKSVHITQAKDLAKSARGRKERFIKALVPMIDQVKLGIKEDKKKVEGILGKDPKKRTQADYALLEENYQKYKVKSKTPQELLKKMVLPPTSLILAQASVESGWGSSKLARAANNLFGMTSYSKSNSNSIRIGRVRYKRYASMQDSVEDYVMTLSRHASYRNLRGGIRRGEDSVRLVQYLGSYSELGSTYGKYVAKIITSNKLQNHDSDS